jgi:nitrogen fixation protein FixH
MVLACFIAFFGTIFAMNAVLVRAATSTFGGVETESSYKAGLAFKNDIAAAQAQDALHWSVGASFDHERDGTRFTVSARDAQDRPLAGLAGIARLSHPADRRQDVPLDLVEIEAGRFQSLAPVSAGQWDLVIELKRGDETVFRSRSRIRL